MKRFSKYLNTAVIAGAVVLLASSASAHVTVKPAEVGVGSFQTFNVSVPVEKAMPTVGLRLVMPSGLEHVSPTVKPGWNIRTVEQAAPAGKPAGTGEHTDGVITEIIWTGGRIPEHFRDDFTFSAKVPSTPVDLSWKAYQTYSDGSIVAWEMAPGQADAEGKGPASVTKVIDDLAAPTAKDDDADGSEEKGDDNTSFLSIAAILISAFSVYLAKKK